MIYTVQNSYKWKAFFYDLAGQFLPGKGDDVFRKIVKDDYFTLLN